jgi:hypothetical protein
MLEPALPPDGRLRIVVAMPTVPERSDACAEASADWRRLTPVPVEVVTSLVPGGWCAGLNDVWRRRRGADLFVCASDDMVPENEGWLEPLLTQLRRGVMPVPCVIDPRWTNYGGFDEPVPDGTPSPRCTFPILAGGWLDIAFPLPDDLHYFGDDLIRDRLLHAGIPSVAVPSSRIRHHFDQRGRGAGAGSEGARMEIDSPRYRRELARLGSAPDGPSEPTFTVAVIATGRPSLYRTLETLAGQLTRRDEVIVVGRSEQPRAQEICAHLQRPGWRYREHRRADGTLAFAVDDARGDRLCTISDDLAYLPDAFAAIRRACVEGGARPQMFRVNRADVTRWAARRLSRGNVEAAMFVPVIDHRLAECACDEFAFIAETVARQGEPDWRPQVVATTEARW